MVPAPVGFQCPECVRAAQVALRGLWKPYATYSLLVANVAVWLVGVGLALSQGHTTGLLEGGALSGVGGLNGHAVAAGQWWRLVTAAFLHAGLLHLAFNMGALYLFGPPLERSLGRPRFLALYLTSLLAGSLGALVLSPGALTVGASGAIFGLFGGILAAQRASGINLRSGGMLPLLIINLVFTIALPGISIGGHLGGLAGGLIAGTLFYDRRLRGRPGLSLVACLGLAAVCAGLALWVAANPVF